MYLGKLTEKPPVILRAAERLPSFSIETVENRVQFPPFWPEISAMFGTAGLPRHLQARCSFSAFRSQILLDLYIKNGGFMQQNAYN